MILLNPLLPKGGTELVDKLDGRHKESRWQQSAQNCGIWRLFHSVNALHRLKQRRRIDLIPTG